MHTKSISTLVGVALLVSAQSACAQINFEQFLTNSNNPFLIVREYRDVPFAWNMPGRIQLLLNEGLNDLKEEHPQQAILSFDSALYRDPSLWMAWYYLGVSHKLAGQLNAADSDFEQAIRRKPDLGEAWIQRGTIAILFKKFDKADEFLRKSVEVDPKSAEGYYFLATLVYIKGDLKEAMKLYEQASEVNARFAPALLMQALLKLKTKTQENQIELFTRAISADSSYAQSWFWRGLLYASLSRPNDALQDWNRMVRLKPNDPFLLLMRGQLFIKLQDYDRAFVDLRKALLAYEVNENKVKTALNATNRKIDLQSAAKYLVRTGYGLDTTAFEQMKKAFCLLFDNKNVEALKCLKIAEKEQPSATVYLLQALAFDRGGRFDSAFHRYDMALALDNNIFDAHKKRGYYRSRRGDWKGANADLNEMIRLRPGSPLVYRLRGEIKYYFRDYYGTLVDLTTFLKSDSTNIEVIEMRADARFHVEDFAGANQDYHKLLTFGHDSLIYGKIGKTYEKVHDTIQAIRSYRIYSKALKTPNSKLNVVRALVNIKAFEAAQDENNHLIQQCLLSEMPEAARRSLMATLLFVDGYCCYQMKSYQPAIERLTLCLNQTSQNKEAKYWRAKAYLAIGNFKKAKSDLRSVRSLGGFLDSDALYHSL